MRSADPLDLALIGLSVLSLVFSFFHFYTYSGSGGGPGATDTTSAWHGFLGWLGVVLMLVGAVLTAAKMLRLAPQVPSSDALMAGLYAVAFLCLLLTLFIVPGDTSGTSALGIHVDKGHGFGYWLVLAFSLVAAAIAGFRFRTRLMH